MTAVRDSWTDERLDDLNKKVDDGFERLDRRFEQTDQRFMHVETRLDEIQRTMTHGFIALFAGYMAGFGVLGALIIALA